MNLRDKLAELRNNILRDRSALIAGPRDTLWDDETLLRYIKDAERRFARQALVIKDATTAQYTQIKLKTGVSTYALNSLVLGILSARYDTDTVDLARSGHSILYQNLPADYLTFDPSTAGILSPRRPIAYYTDETLVYANGNAVTLTVYPAPSATENGKTINLRVFRLPNTTYTVAALKKDECGEIPEDYELDVLEWAAYRAQRNYDADGASLTTAESHKERFDAAVKEALKETRRKLFVPIRVQYGSNGFSYTR